MKTTTTINDKSEAYNIGYEACIQDESRSANPYVAGTVEAANWYAGWDVGQESLPFPRGYNDQE